jgi:hypothetical protein
MDNFDLKRFLVENKMTRNSRLLNEDETSTNIPADDPLAQIPAVPAETPSEPSGEIDVETAKELIFNTKGKFFTVTFLAQDKDERGKQKIDANGVKLFRPRIMNARLGVKKYLKGGTLKYDPAEFNYITVYDMGAKGYRTVNADTIQNLKIGNRNYTISQETIEPTTDEPQLNENARPEDIGKGTRLFFKDDKTTYYAKNIAPDKKNVFVIKDGSDDVFKKSIAKIVQIDNKKF